MICIADQCDQGRKPCARAECGYCDEPLYTSEDTMSLTEKAVCFVLGLVGLVCATSPVLWDWLTK